MLDYALFVLFFQKEIKSIEVIGNYFIPTILNNLMLTKQIKKQQNSQVLVLYNQNYHQILENLNPSNEWVVIYNDNLQELIKIYKSMRSFSHEVFLNDKNFMMILHNLKSNYINEIDKQQILPAMYTFIDDYLNLNIYETKPQTKICVGNINEQLTQSLISQNEFIYTGGKISEKDILKCQMLLRTQFKIIECKQDSETVGYFFHNDFKEKIWLFLLSKNDSIKNIYQLDKHLIIVPVKSV
jgi:hypothetical protein